MCPRIAKYVEEKIIIFVLSTLSLRKLAFIQFWIWNINYCVSFAWQWNWAPNVCKMSPRGRRYIVNNAGRNTCTPHFGFDMLSYVFIIATYWVWSFAILWIGLKPAQGHPHLFYMMTSSNGNIFRVTGHLCEEFTGHRWIPLIKASDAELWCFISYVPEQAAEQTIVRPVNWDTIALIMTSL